MVTCPIGKGENRQKTKKKKKVGKEGQTQKVEGNNSCAALLQLVGSSD